MFLALNRILAFKYFESALDIFGLCKLHLKTVPNMHVILYGFDQLSLI